jgi:hypothetical protein
VLDWLVITADRTRGGRGIRGYTLAWFLRIYFGRRRVGIVSPDVLRQSPIAADTVFVGLPSSLAPDEVERIFGGGRYRRVVLFDYLDLQELAWTAEQEPAFRQVTNHYFRPWFEEAWNYGLRMGLLPIRRSGRLTAAIMLDRAFRKLGRRPTPIYDVAFLGQPNDTRVIVDGKLRKIDQRFDWLREIRRDAPDLRFWGGFIGGDPEIVARLTAEHGDLSPYYHPAGKVGFPAYYQAMRRSRVLLAPGGNAPWTYRHYECLYAGGVVVTIDFRQRDLLIPLPNEGVVHVADGAPVVPAIREALELSELRRSFAEQHFAHLEQYLRFGAYSRTCPALIERFRQQLR